MTARQYRRIPTRAHVAPIAQHLPPASADVSELWHTRVMQGRTYAAVYPQAVLPLGGDTSFAADTPLGGFFSQMDTKATAHPDQPMDVERLILSAVGAWFGGSISWDNHALDWTHRAAMGRDFYVYVLESGVLFPFGHKAALVMTFEREFSSGKPPLAALREHTSLVVIESTHSYDSIAERQFPFQVVELTSQLIDELDEPPSTTMFWPMRSGTPVLFPVRAHAAATSSKWRCRCCSALIVNAPISPTSMPTAHPSTQGHRLRPSGGLWRSR